MGVPEQPSGPPVLRAPRVRRGRVHRRRDERGAVAGRALRAQCVIRGVERAATISTMATMSDVAKHAGVGIGTVSRVLSGSSKVSEKTRSKVHTSAEQLGYNRPRKSAAEQAKRDRLVGVVVPFFDEKSTFSRIRGIVSRLALHGCEIVLHNIESPAQARAKMVKLPRSTILNGLIVISLPLVGDEGDRLV